MHQPDREVPTTEADAVWEALPARWAIGPVTYDPGPRRQMGAFRVTARGPHPGRAKVPQTVTGTGEDETAALRDLDAALRGAKRADGSYLEDLRKLLRLVYVDAAKQWTRENVGRAMTPDELGRVIGRYVGR